MTRQRTAVVSGGTVGIGRGIVDRLLADNYIVYTFSRTDSRVEELKKAYASSPALTVIKGDVKDAALHSRLSEEIMQKHGSLDVLVNSAGIMTATGYIEEPLSAWREVLETNLLAPVALIQALYPLLQKGNTPSIINITSVCGLKAYTTC
ncbi:MAG: SDR family oxidoreductase, partial [Rhodomicrobium sp.]